MAIKIKGDTIIDDGRVLVNADKIGIGTTNPQVALEIFSGDVGIGTTNPSASNIKTSLESNTNILAVGIVTADNIFGTFKGTLDTSAAITNADNIEITDSATDVSGTHYIHFGDATSSYDNVEVDSEGLIYKDGFVGIGTTIPGNPLHISSSSDEPLLVHSTSPNSSIRFQNSVGSSGYIGYLEVTRTIFLG